MRTCHALFILFAASLFAETVLAQSELAGKWVLDGEASSAVDPWNRIELEIAVDKATVEIDEMVTTGRRFHVSHWKLNTGKRKSVNAQDWWVGNRHIGAFYGNDGRVETGAKWLENEGCLLLESHYRLETSQGGGDVREHVEYRLSGDGGTLTRITLRSTRDQPIVHVFTRK